MQSEHVSQKTIQLNSLSSAMDIINNIQIDKSSILQERLDLKTRERTNYFPWRGQFSPELVYTLLDQYSSSNFVVLDPFAGSGTTLYESARKKLTCYGAEINPAAVVFSRSYEFVNLDKEERSKLVLKTKKIIEEALPRLTRSTLFSHEEKSGDNSITERIFRELIQKSTEDSYVNNILLNSIIRFYSLKSRNKTVSDRLLLAFNQHVTIINSLPYSQKPCKIYLADARELPNQNSSVDLVITSPPYINVFNYHQNHRNVMELAGWDILEIAKSEIGSNRKNRGNRFLTVVQYSIDMLQSLLELKRVVKKNGRIIIVIGRESKIRGVSFENFKILSSLALYGAGLNLVCRQERKFTNRFGQEIVEDILHLSPTSYEIRGSDTEIGREIGARFLQNALKAANGEVKEDIEIAIKSIEKVGPSPMLVGEKY